MDTLTVVLADDNPDVLSDLREALREFDIVSTADNGEGALSAVNFHAPDVLVVDISLPDMNGLKVAARLREAHSRTKIIFLTVHEDPEYISAGFAAGASGYVFKGRLASDLAHAIRDVIAGGTFLSPALRK